MSSSAVAFDDVVALDVFLADVEEAHRRPLDAVDRRASAVPMTANWTSCSGVQLTLAPRSSTVVAPVRVGSCEAIAGRSIPGSIFSTKREIAISAPVLPAETHACARRP